MKTNTMIRCPVCKVEFSVTTGRLCDCVHPTLEDKSSFFYTESSHEKSDLFAIKLYEGLSSNKDKTRVWLQESLEFQYTWMMAVVLDIRAWCNVKGFDPNRTPEEVLTLYKLSADIRQKRKQDKQNEIHPDPISNV